MIKQALQPLLWFFLLASVLALASGLALSIASVTHQPHCRATPAA